MPCNKMYVVKIKDRIGRERNLSQHKMKANAMKVLATLRRKRMRARIVVRKTVRTVQGRLKSARGL